MGLFLIHSPRVQIYSYIIARRISYSSSVIRMESMATQSEGKSDEGKIDVTTLHLDDNSHSNVENAEAIDENSSSKVTGRLKGNSVSSSDSHSEDDEVSSTGHHDSIDGNAINRALSFIDGKDEEINLKEPLKVQLYSLNEQPGSSGGFLKMELDGDSGFKVTTTGERLDPHALWLAHRTVDGEFREIVIFQNKACSDKTRKSCVLYTQHIDETDDYILAGKKLDSIPERYVDIQDSVGFYKRPKAIGSELLFLKSMLTTKDRPLLVGFDGAGQPIPLNKVKKYSTDFQAFFRVLEGG